MELSLELLQVKDMLVKQVHHWSKSRHKVVLNNDHVNNLIGTLVSTHKPVWLKGDPEIKFGVEIFFIDKFVEIIGDRLLKTPGAVDGVGSPFGGVQDQEETTRNDRFDQSVSCQLITRLLRANPGRWFSVDQIGIELDLMAEEVDLSPKELKFRNKTRKKIRRYVQQVRSFNSSVKTRHVNRSVQYSFVDR